jgi:hypothetical protein
MEAVFVKVQQVLGLVPDWFVGLVLIAGPMVAALLVHSIGVRVARRMLGRRLVCLAILIRTVGPTRLALCLAAIAFVLPRAP